MATSRFTSRPVFPEICKGGQGFRYQPPGRFRSKWRRVHLVPSLRIGIRSWDIPGPASGIATKPGRGPRRPSFDLQTNLRERLTLGPNQDCWAHLQEMQLDGKGFSPAIHLRPRMRHVGTIRGKRRRLDLGRRSGSLFQFIQASLRLIDARPCFARSRLLDQWQHDFPRHNPHYRLWLGERLPGPFAQRRPGLPNPLMTVPGGGEIESEINTRGLAAHVRAKPANDANVVCKTIGAGSDVTGG